MYAGIYTLLGATANAMCERAYLIVSEGSFYFFAVFLDGSRIVRSRDKSCNFILCLERVQDICDGVQLSKVIINEFSLLENKGDSITSQVLPVVLYR
jgi:hypothetical protein